MLELTKTAFSGEDGLDPRQEVLKSTAALDVEACPGSGKTTLLVAKLAVLARKWTQPRRGICVLSHTNVARREIERRLGNTAAGQQLLSYPEQDPAVEVRLGSIHSIKGETHTATLVCETYFRAHHLMTLKPWLLQKKAGGARESGLSQSRMKQHYVAMTRPTHLLCLAMREDALDQGEIATLKARKWRVGRVTDGPIQWI